MINKSRDIYDLTYFKQDGYALNKWLPDTTVDAIHNHLCDIMCYRHPIYIIISAESNAMPLSPLLDRNIIQHIYTGNNRVPINKVI